MSMATVSDISEKFCRFVVDGIRKNIEEMDATGFGPSDNTGQAKNSLKYEITEKGLRIFSDMTGAKFNYLYTLETGRKPGKMPPIDNIEDWLKQRGINPPDITQRSLAFLIARRIGREGSSIYRKGGKSGVISEAINDRIIREQLIKPLREILAKELRTSLTEAA